MKKTRMVMLAHYHNYGVSLKGLALFSISNRSLKTSLLEIYMYKFYMKINVLMRGNFGIK
jgi:hypothetical protein